MNFANAVTAAAGFGDLNLGDSGQVSPTPRGMWHQFGTLPTNETEGIFLEMGSIPEQWLKNHYEAVTGSSIYNNYTPSEGPEVYKNMKSFARLMGFDNENSRVRLGELKDKQVIKEAVVAVPYIVEGLSTNESQPTGANAKARKKFINIPKKRFTAALKEREGSKSGDSLDAAGDSIRRMVQKSKEYVLPPQFDFVNNKDVDPIVMYIFEFKYELDKDDLSYIWQNLAPRDYTKMEFQKDSVAHELVNTELLTEKNLLSNPNLRWMLFKVKQKSQATYNDMTVSQVGQATRQKIDDSVELNGYNLKYNWPYDYVSIVESIKTDVDVLYKQETRKRRTIETKKTTDKQNTTLSKKQRRKKKVRVNQKKRNKGN